MEGRVKRPTEAFRSARLFEDGFGYVAICRFKSDGRCESGFFLLDLYCLGAKDGGFASFDCFADCEEDLLETLFRSEDLVSMSPVTARKLIEDTVAYARDLGFAPGADYKKASRVLGGISTADCEEEFVFGRDGKPFYIQGPSDSPERRERILQTLERRCGEGGFEYTVAADFGDFDLPDEEEIADGESGALPESNLAALQEMASRLRAEQPKIEVRVNPTGRPKISDRLALVAEPLMEMADDDQMRKMVLQFAALAWNFAKTESPRSEEILADVREMLPSEDGEELFRSLADRANQLFPEDERIILHVEMDPARDGVNDLRVTSVHPGDQPGADPKSGNSGFPKI